MYLPCPLKRERARSLGSLKYRNSFSVFPLFGMFAAFRSLETTVFQEESEKATEKCFS